MSKYPPQIADSTKFSAPIDRAETNFWRAQYFQALHELTKANKGIRRLKAKIERIKKEKSYETQIALKD